MAIYKLFPTKDSTIYSRYPNKNTGLDEILDVSIEDATASGNPQANRFLIQFSQTEISDILTNKVGNSLWSASLTAYLAYGDGKYQESDITIRTTDVVNTGNWVFVSVTRQKSTGNVVLYVNGLPDTRGICNVGNTLSTATNVLIGSETDFTGYTFGGNIGAILANTSVLTDEEIMNNFNAQRNIYGI